MSFLVHCAAGEAAIRKACIRTSCFRRRPWHVSNIFKEIPFRIKCRILSSKVSTPTPIVSLVFSPNCSLKLLSEAPVTNSGRDSKKMLLMPRSRKHSAIAVR